jgi:hypothetical protein
MGDDVLERAADSLRALQRKDAAVERLAEKLDSSIKVGNISNSSAVTIGRDIRLVINQFNLPAETVAALLDARSALGGLDAGRYQLAYFVQNKTEGFVGREHVFRAITAFLESQPSGYMTIWGDPGMGKTTLLAEYVRRTGCIVHFNSRGQGIVHPSQFTENVSAQIIAEFGLPYAGLPGGATQDGSFLARMLGDASQKLARGERLVIAVDALDEVDLASHTHGGNVLYLPRTLPGSVYFILTRRDVKLPFDVETPQVGLNLMNYPAENRRDVETYLRRCSERPRVRQWIQNQPGLGATGFVDTLAEKSQNNFMYLRFILLDIESGLYSDIQAGRLPVGLQGYYDSHWRLMGMTARPLPRLKILIIYILSVVELPVSRRQLSGFLKGSGVEADELAVQEVLDEWEQFLHKEPGPGGMHYSIYHTSFRDDFLKQQEIVQAAGVTIPYIHTQISSSITAPIQDELEGW